MTPSVLESVPDRQRAWSVPRIAALMVLAVAVRLTLFGFVSGNMNDWVMPWFDYLDTHGFAALGGHLPNYEGFAETSANYAPPYYYLLYAATWLDDWIPKLYAIKLVSVAFDFVAAVFMYRLVAATTTGVSPWVGFFSVLFAPTVLLNGSLWGQCDVIPHSLVLGAVYFTVARRSLAAFLCVGLAVSVKATPVFAIPYLAMLALRRWVPWRQFVFIPLAYGALMVPALLMGRSAAELATVYLTQGRHFDRLSMDSANWYHFIPNEHYVLVTILGTAIALVACAAYALLPRRRREVALSPEFLVLAATLSVAMVPFLLPKMHDRYFFPADLLSIALALSNRRLWFVAVGFQLASSLAYLPVLSESWTWHWLDPLTALFPAAIATNTFLVVVLAWRYVRSARGEGMVNA